jgi:hypothetical protein
VPDDLLRYVIGPTPVPWWWLFWVLLLVAVLIGWYVAVFAWTRPPESRHVPHVVERVQAALVRRRFAGAVRRVGERFRAGDLDGAHASAALSATLRDFLTAATGARARYMQLHEMTEGEVARAAPLLARINDVQFNARSGEDVAGLSEAAEELILTWT